MEILRPKKQIAGLVFSGVGPFPGLPFFLRMHRAVPPHHLPFVLIYFTTTLSQVDPYRGIAAGDGSFGGLDQPVTIGVYLNP